MPDSGGGVRWQGNAHLATLLSVQLLLLAFFALLTATSHFEGDRTRRVMDSVQAAFGSVARGNGEDTVGASDSVALRAFHADVGRLLRTAIPLTRVETTAWAEEVRVVLPADAFFRPAEAGLTSSGRLLLGRLVAAAERRPPGYRYDIEVGQPEGPPEALLLARADALVRGLAAAGAPPHGLSVALGRGEGGRLRFVIRLRRESEPRRLFDRLADAP